MDKVTYVKTKYRQDQWEKLIADCQSSGLQVDEWCEKNKISRNAYYYKKTQVFRVDKFPLTMISIMATRGTWRQSYYFTRP